MILVYTGCAQLRSRGHGGLDPFWRFAYGTDLMAMALVAYGADAEIPTMAPQQQIRRAAVVLRERGTPQGAGGDHADR